MRSGPLPSTKRKRQSDILIWARDGDNEKAQEHPAYILEIEDVGDEDGAPSSNNNNNDQVWIEWASNGTTAQITKSRISSTGLTTRRRRNNDNSKGSGGDTNETSTSVSNKSIKVANESVKSKDEMYEKETGDNRKQSNDDDTDADIALTKLKEQSTAVPSPVASSQLKQEGLYDDDTDEDIAPDFIKSAQVKTEEDVYGEETDEEDGKEAAVLSTAISNSITNETDDDSDSDAESDSDEEAKTIARWDASNEEFNNSAKVYLWCEGKGRDEYGRSPGYGGLVLLPYNWYLFYEKLKRCNTWGDIRTLCDDDTYQTLVDRYERKYYSDEELTDRKSVCMDDFDLSEHESYGDLTAVGMFPPVLEQVMWGAAINQLPCAGNKFLSFRRGQQNVNSHSWMLDLGNAEGTWYEEQWLKFDYGEKDEIFEKIEELGCTVRYFPKLGKKFTSVYEM